MKTALFLFIFSLLTLTASAEPEPAFDAPKLTLPSQISDPIPEWLAHWELARALTYAERYHEALDQYKVLQQMRPDLAITLQREMITVLFWSGDNDSALKLLKQLGADTDDDEKMLLGDLLVADKKYDEAALAYQSLLISKPDNDEARLRLAEVLSWQKKYSDSITLYKQVLERHPDDNNIRKKYGMVLMWSGDQKEAIVQLQKALEDSDEK
jgi:tetratricopeptide (TPR) repeat protein